MFGGASSITNGGNPSTISQAANFNAAINRREQKEVSKDTFTQARLFKQLHDETQQLNNILTRTVTQGATASGDPFGTETGSRYLGFSYGLGQRTGGFIGAFDQKKPESSSIGGRSIDQLFQNFKSKADQKMIDPVAENESKAFFASKNVDIASLEYNLKQAQNSFLQFKTQ